MVRNPMTDEPIPNRITEQEEFHRNVYGHLDAIRLELLEQDERLEHLQALVTNLVNARPMFDWRNNISCVIIGLVIGILIGWYA
jgi:hypothetical protein